MDVLDLSAEQVRVLGCLLEKAATTPDQYPLSSHALTAACNQKSSRDPVVAYAERDVDRVMLELRQLGLARTVQAASARVSKHKHVLDEAWGLTAEQLAVLAILMLRAPSTLNELHTRTERYVTWDGVDAVRAAIRSLEERTPPLAAELPRQAGQRETRFTHRVGAAAVASAAPTQPSAAAPHAASTPASPPPPAPAPPSSTTAALEAELAAVRAELDDLRRRFDELCRRLGEEI